MSLLSNYYISSRVSKGIIDSVPISKILISEKCYSYRSDTIKTNYNEEDQNLLNSIMENGLLYPLLVRNLENNYELIAGKRRLEACRKLGWRKVICNIIEASEKEAYEISLNENLQKRDVDTLEEAEAFRKYVFEFGWGGITELSSKINKSKSYIAKKIKLLELPDDILKLVDEGSVSPSTAEELLPVKNAGRRSNLIKLINNDKLSKLQTRNLVKGIREEHDDSDCLIYNDFNTKMFDMDKKTQRSFDQAITAVKLAMNKVSILIEENEDNWIIYERLMHLKLTLHNQIDLLIKDRKKL